MPRPLAPMLRVWTAAWGWPIPSRRHRRSVRRIANGTAICCGGQASLADKFDLGAGASVRGHDLEVALRVRLAGEVDHSLFRTVLHRPRGAVRTRLGVQESTRAMAEGRKVHGVADGEEVLDRCVERLGQLEV